MWFITHSKGIFSSNLFALIYLQPELWSKGIYALHYLGKVMLVRLPLLVLKEEVHLYWQTGVGGLQLADHECKVGVDLLVVLYPLLYVVAEERKVYNIALQLLLLHKLSLHESLLKVVVGNAYGVEVDVYHARYTASVALLHSLPVLKRVFYKLLWRHRNDSVVEVAHLYSGQRHVLNHTISTQLVYRYPVALAHHIVACKAYSGNQTRYRILKHQHQYSRCGTQSGKKRQRTAVYNDSHNDDNAEEKHHYLEHSAEGVEVLLGCCAVVLVRVE